MIGKEKEVTKETFQTTKGKNEFVQKIQWETHPTKNSPWSFENDPRRLILSDSF